MAKKRVTALTVNKAKELHKKFDEMDEMVLEINGQQFKVKYNKHFSETKINEVIKRFLVAYSKLNSINAPKGLIPSFYVNLLIIKEFTSLGQDANFPEDLEGQLDMLNVLLDLDVFFKILGSLPQSELNKVNDRISDLIIQLSDNYELMKRAIDEAIDKGNLENGDAFKAVMEKYEELAEQKAKEQEAKMRDS